MVIWGPEKGEGEWRWRPHLMSFTDERICFPSDLFPLKGVRDPMSERDDFLTTTLARQIEAKKRCTTAT